MIIFFALSFHGILFKSKETKKFNLVYKQVNEFNKTRVVQISGKAGHFLVLTEEGKVYSFGNNINGQLGIGNNAKKVDKFTEILSLRQYKIQDVYAGSTDSLFMTTNGQVLACGDNEYNVLLIDARKEGKCIRKPTETLIKKKRAKFCIAGSSEVAVFIGFDPEKSPNRRIKNEFEIRLFGIDQKTMISQIFINNNDGISNDDNNNITGNEYKIKIDIDKEIVNVTLIDHYCQMKNSKEEKKNYL